MSEQRSIYINLFNTTTWLKAVTSLQQQRKMMIGRKLHKDCEKDLFKYESFSLILKLIIEALIIHRNTYVHTYIHSNERPVI